MKKLKKEYKKLDKYSLMCIRLETYLNVIKMAMDDDE